MISGDQVYHDAVRPAGNPPALRTSSGSAIRHGALPQRLLARSSGRFYVPAERGGNGYREPITNCDRFPKTSRSMLPARAVGRSPGLTESWACVPQLCFRHRSYETNLRQGVSPVRSMRARECPNLGVVRHELWEPTRTRPRVPRFTIGVGCGFNPRVELSSYLLDRPVQCP